MRYLVILAGLLCSAVAFGQVWRWVDANGVVHYSDMPVAGAEKVELPKAQTFGSTPPPVEPRGSEAGAGDAPGPEASAVQRSEYRAFDIVRPQSGETLWNIGATLTVSLRISPGLAPGDRIFLLYDGVEQSGLPRDSLDITLNDVYRGTHTIQAQVRDPNDRVLIQTSTNTFYVQQTSILRRR